MFFISAFLIRISLFLMDSTLVDEGGEEKLNGALIEPSRQSFLKRFQEAGLVDEGPERAVQGFPHKANKKGVASQVTAHFKHQRESARSKTTTLHVHNMSRKCVACLLIQANEQAVEGAAYKRRPEA